jgi:hypothetical protein
MPVQTGIGLSLSVVSILADIRKDQDSNKLRSLAGVFVRLNTWIVVGGKFELTDDGEI